MLEVLVRLDVISKVKLTVSNHLLLSSFKEHSLKASKLWLLLFSDSILFNSSLHFNFFIEFSDSTIIDSGILSFEVIRVPHESEEALLVLQI